MSSGNIKSGILKRAQALILSLKLNYVIKPFAGALKKLVCLSEFADWKKRSDNNKALKGYRNRFTLYKDIITNEKLDLICYYEFGVSTGESMRWWLSNVTHADARFFGFDTFDGIPEAWGTKPIGSYTNNGNLPEVNDSRCIFIQGLFQNTLSGFLQKQECKHRLVIHLDADLYSSTLFCLFSLANHLKTGDLIIFDEFNITTHEFRAFADFQNTVNINVLFIGESDNYNKVVFKVI